MKKTTSPPKFVMVLERSVWCKFCKRRRSRFSGQIFELLQEKLALFRGRNNSKQICCEEISRSFECYNKNDAVGRKANLADVKKKSSFGKTQCFCWHSVNVGDVTSNSQIWKAKTAGNTRDLNVLPVSHPC